MHRRICVVLLAAAVLAIALSACGSSSSGNARSLLRQTFSGQHRVDSGNLSFRLSVTPTGSTTLTQPISLAFSGPFQSRGKGKLPESDFTVSISAQGHSYGVSLISTGTKGYVTASGASYQLPAASFQKLESSFSSITSSAGGSSGGKSGTLSRLGINPLDWLRNPSVIGTETVAGATTTHIRAGVNVSALLRDLNTFVQKAASLGVSGASQASSSLSPATQQRIAAAVRNPRFDVWTGSNDKTVRKLSVGLSLPVSGQLSSLLGGMRTAGIDLVLQYSDLNRPQTIAAPTNVKPYRVFASKLAAVIQAVEGTLSSGALGGTTGTGTTGSGTTGSGTSGSGATGSGTAGSGAGATGTGTTGTSASDPYSRCIAAAGQDVAKMQKCASLPGG